MDGFDHILNWKLKAGSHPFPGPDGGTCINEAALVAMGFKYRPIAIVQQMPRCFSRPICRLAMLVNDSVGDKERQRLLPYVTRLACAGTPEIERQREAYIQSQMPTGRLTKGRLSIEKGIEILEGALAIGWQPKQPALDMARTRMDAAKAKVTTVTSKPDSSLFGKVTAWLTVGKVPEPTD